MGNQMLDTATERRPFVLVVEGVPYIVGHKDYEASSCEKLLPRPVHDERFVTLADAASFAEYIKLHGQKNSAVYVSATWPASNKPLAEVVIDVLPVKVRGVITGLRSPRYLQRHSATGG